MKKKLIIKGQKGTKLPGWFMKTLMHGAYNNPELSGGGQWFNTATGYKQDENGNVYQDSKVWEDDAPEAELRKGLALIGAAPIAGEALPTVAEGALNVMNKAFTPSSWTNIYGLKILGNTAGRVADAAVLAGFTAEGAKGLYDQKQEGTLTLKNPQTYMNSLMLLPLAGKVAESAAYGINKGIQKASQLEKKAGNAINRAIANRKYNIEGTYANKDKFIQKFKEAYPEQYFDLNTLSLLALNDHEVYPDFPFNVTQTPEGKVIAKRIPLSSNFVENSYIESLYNPNLEVLNLDFQNPENMTRRLFDSKLRGQYIKDMTKLDDNRLLRLYFSSIGEPVENGYNVVRYSRDIHQNDITEAAAKELTKRLGFDFNDPVNNYDKIVKYVRSNPNSPYVKSGAQYELPGDIGHLYWMQGIDGSAKGAQEGLKAGFKLSQELPEYSAVTELNKSPESWMEQGLFTLRNYGTEPGQNTFLFLKNRNGGYYIGTRNTAQKTFLDRDKLIDAYIKEGGDPKVLLSYLNKFYRMSPETASKLSRNQKLDNFIEKQIDLTDHVDLDRMNKRIQSIREKTGLKDLPDATVAIPERGKLGSFLFSNGYKPRILSFDFYSIRHKKGGKLIPRKK